MLTYILVLLVVIAVLYGSFRALGGGAEPVATEDYRALLRRLHGYAGERIAELDAALQRPRPLPGEPADPLVETGGEVRRKLTGYRQQLAQIEVHAEGDELETLGSARALLTAALEDESWACRLVEGGSYRENPGIQDAVAVLRDHAARCMDATLGALDAGGAPLPLPRR